MVDSLVDYIAGFGDNLNLLVEELQLMVNSLNDYIMLSTYYIWLSGVVLLLLFVFSIATLKNQALIKRQNQHIIEQNEYIMDSIEVRNKKGGNGNG
jgi:hypothetical protein